MAELPEPRATRGDEYKPWRSKKRGEREGSRGYGQRATAYCRPHAGGLAKRPSQASTEDLSPVRKRFQSHGDTHDHLPRGSAVLVVVALLAAAMLACRTGQVPAYVCVCTHFSFLLAVFRSTHRPSVSRCLMGPDRWTETNGCEWSCLFVSYSHGHLKPVLIGCSVCIRC